MSRNILIDNLEISDIVISIMPIDKKKLFQSRKEYKKYCKRAATRSRRGETWSKESLPIVYVNKSEITGTRRPSNEPVDHITGSSESVVLQGMNK